MLIQTIVRKNLPIYIIFFLFIQCESDSCEGESPKAKIESNSYSISSSRVWVTLNHQESGQSYQFVDITENNPKSSGSLPTGNYSINASVAKSTGTTNLRVSAKLSDCFKYKVFVNATNLSMYVNGTPR